MSVAEVLRIAPPFRLRALIKKESLQIIRDPFALLIAFILPLMLLFLFVFAVSLDVSHVRVGVVLQSSSSSARDLAAAYAASPYLDVNFSRNRAEVERQLIAGDIRGFVVIPQDFEQLILHNRRTALVQIITDGSQPNTATFTDNYSRGVLNRWLEARAAENGSGMNPPFNIETRFWFNPELESRFVLLPGAIAIVMTMIGTLLTALVMAREWERGTMEALMSTPTSIIEIVLGKLIPYFVLGLTTTLGCTLFAITAYGLPFEGSVLALLAVSCVFMLPALGQGLLISALAKNQFIAAQVALISGFLPAFLLSGFLFEIDSMPIILQYITHIVPARYYVAALQTIFLTGDIWWQLLREMCSMLVIGVFFFVVILIKTKKSLD